MRPGREKKRMSFLFPVRGASSNPGKAFYGYYEKRKRGNPFLEHKE